MKTTVSYNSKFTTDGTHVSQTIKCSLTAREMCQLEECVITYHREIKPLKRGVKRGENLLPVSLLKYLKEKYFTGIDRIKEDRNTLLFIELVKDE